MVLLLATAGLHVWYLMDDCPIDLSGDEAHYWEWSQRLDWSYYSKGPLVAYIIAGARALLADWSLRMVGSEALAVRLPAVLLGALSGLGVFELGAAALGRPRVALASVALLCTIPLVAAGSLLMTIDAPLMCAWVWALVLLLRGMRSDALACWVGVGVLTALGILAKYTMLLLAPALLALLVFDPSARRVLRRPGVYVALLIGALGCVPIVVWNQQHDWVSLRHVAGQAGMSGKLRFDPGGILAYAGGQLAVVGPVWLIALAWAVASGLRGWSAPSERAGERRLLICACVVPYAVFLLFSPFTKIQPNWPVLGLPSGVILLADFLRAQLAAPQARARRAASLTIALASVSGLGLVLIAHDTRPLLPLLERLSAGAPAWELTPIARYDPTARLKGWRTLGAAVGEALAAERGAGRTPFILTDEYQLASLVRFYTPGNPPTYSAQAALGGRQSQYDIWENPLRERAKFVGRPVLYIGSRSPQLTGSDSAPGALPDLRQVRLVEYRERGRLLAIWSIWSSPAYRGFPESAAPDKY